MDALKGLTLTRVGNFEFRDGYLTDGQGNVVYGFITRSNGDAPGTTPGDKPSTDLVPIRLPMKSTDPNSKGDAVYVGVDNQTGANVYPDNDPAATVDGFVDLENISIDKNGKITGTNKDTGDPVVVGYIALGSVENLNGRSLALSAGGFPLISPTSPGFSSNPLPIMMRSIAGKAAVTFL